jgi:exonuclease VII large subunit
VEALTKLEATLSRDIALLDSSMLEKSAQQDERADELSAMVTQIEKSAKEDLSAQTRESSAQLAEVKADLGGDLRALEQKVDVEVRDQISTLDADVGRRLSDLKNLVEDKVQKSIDTMSTSLDAMNTRVKKEMEPKLAETELAVRSVSSKLETLETRVMLEQDELKTGMTKSLETMSTELDELGEKVDGMTADLDINALLMGAASAKP